MKKKDEWIPLAEVARPHGVRGELRLKVFNRDSEVLRSLDEVLVRMKSGEEHKASVSGTRWADQALLMRLASVDNRDRADELRGALICAKRDAFPPADEGEFYYCDALGAHVFVGEEDVGTVREVRSYPTVDLLVIRASDGGKDWEIPLVDAFVKELRLDFERIELHSLDGIERG